MLTLDEREKIDELRKRVKDELVTEDQHSDYFIIRWLRARSMNLDKAEEMLRKSLKWRKEIGADTLLQTVTVPEKPKKLFMFGTFGEDKDGHPIIILPGGRHAPHHKWSLEEYDKDTLMKWNAHFMERIMEHIRLQREKTGKPIYRYHEVLDMEGYTYRAFMDKQSVEYIIEIQKMFDDNYPEVLKTVTIINAPRIFPLLFAALKPLLPKETLEKITIYGSNEAEWMEALKKLGFPEERVPPRWGGTMKGSDEFCSQEKDCWFDAPIPLKHFKEVPEADEEGYFTVKVGARDKLELKFPSTPENNNGGCTASWKFKTESGDINFQLSFIKEAEDDEIIVVPMKRVDAEREVQQGYSTKHGKGTFVFLFDNGYSFFKSKMLKYQIDLA